MNADGSSLADPSSRSPHRRTPGRPRRRTQIRRRRAAAVAGLVVVAAIVLASTGAAARRLPARRPSGPAAGEAWK